MCVILQGFPGIVMSFPIVVWNISRNRQQDQNALTKSTLITYIPSTYNKLNICSLKQFRFLTPLVTDCHVCLVFSRAASFEFDYSQLLSPLKPVFISEKSSQETKTLAAERVQYMTQIGGLRLVFRNTNRARQKIQQKCTLTASEIMS